MEVVAPLLAVDHDVDAGGLLPRDGEAGRAILEVGEVAAAAPPRLEKPVGARPAADARDGEEREGVAHARTIQKLPGRAAGTARSSGQAAASSSKW